MEEYKIVDTPDFIKDAKSGAILNINKKEVEDYRAKSHALYEAKMAKQTAEDLQKTVETLQNDLAEIKKLLGGLK